MLSAVVGVPERDESGIENVRTLEPSPPAPPVWLPLLLPCSDPAPHPRRLGDGGMGEGVWRDVKVGAS